MSDPVPELTPDRIQKCMADATAALQATCVARNIVLAPDLAQDLVTLLAFKDFQTWTALEQIKRARVEYDDMYAELQTNQTNVEGQLRRVGALLEFATKAKRHWLAQFCPVCWAWSSARWALGFRGPTQEDADRVEDAA